MKSAASGALPFTSTEDALLDLLREIIAEYVDLKDQPIERSTELAPLGVDSLTAAEILFALEDRLGVKMGEPTEFPTTVGGVVDYALPYLEKRVGLQ